MREGKIKINDYSYKGKGTETGKVKCKTGEKNRTKDSWLAPEREKGG